MTFAEAHNILKVYAEMFGGVAQSVHLYGTHKDQLIEAIHVFLTKNAELENTLANLHSGALIPLPTSAQHAEDMRMMAAHYLTTH